MNPEQYTYPNSNRPLTQAYEGRFECVFVVLHPFVRGPEAMAWRRTRQYPEDAQIVSAGTKYPWAEVAERTSLKSCARINHALLSSIGSLDQSVADPAAFNEMQHFLETNPIWMPVEGRFEPLLQTDFLATFDAAGMDELIYVPEFPKTDAVARLSVPKLQGGELPFPPRGTLLAPDASFLFTVDWDSFFTLFYGTREFVTRVAAAQNIEGFFASPNTEHAWWNFSFGCATVTLSPEHWQT